jgi:hypothetical protein
MILDEKKFIIQIRDVKRLDPDLQYKFDNKTGFHIRKICCYSWSGLIIKYRHTNPHKDQNI